MSRQDRQVLNADESAAIADRYYHQLTISITIVMIRVTIVIIINITVTIIVFIIIIISSSSSNTIEYYQDCTINIAQSAAYVGQIAFVIEAATRECPHGHKNDDDKNDNGDDKSNSVMYVNDTIIISSICIITMTITVNVTITITIIRAT